ncbi:hypothetical protein [Sphingomonas parapaucimobilis]|uniref:Uncharacterized protein n=1 Tax=Sphingomonas parapaucimobilis NBRC 15100 TaxID=1219049 RepID=A0A0A1W6J1_9SPHN|nr:hypothetical protein [Sphingomonas parapaucimobilis]GAM00529.1 hypothetical protein SP5_034_01030 [Sphingomonas parapaucimobilis NBRC 15100]
MADAFRRAKRCFALARSTTFIPERNTAIARGMAIAEAAGIDLDRFDIPGRAQAAPKHLPMGFRSQPAPEDYSVNEIGDLMRAHRRHMEEARA